MASQDIVKLILQDHKPLKKLIKVMKSERTEFTERKRAFEEFVPLLVSHSKAEEQSLYVFLKSRDEFRCEGFEAQVEQDLADQVAKDARQSDDEDLTEARIKVLAEMVQHHVEEEEENILPHFKRKIEADVRADLGREYLQFKGELEVADSVIAKRRKASDEESRSLR